MRIAILGTRGIPARYGGFETFAEELSTRLVQRGHEVTVYGRRPFFRAAQKVGSNAQEYLGVKLRATPTIMHKYLETPLHSLTSFVDLLFQRYDVVLLCNAANSPFAWIGRLKRVPLAINVDGIERNRTKWNAFGKLWYLLGERASVLFASRIIADAQMIADYYKERYNCESSIIAYGATEHRREAGEVLKRFGLSPGKYVLYVSRFEPENNPLGVVQAYSHVAGDVPLVMVGDAPYAQEYIAQVKSAADRRVIFTGYQFGEAYQELRSHCLMYVQATEVGGTHPALVEAMCYGNVILANDVPEHREVLLDGGIYYRKNDFEHLAALIQTVLQDGALREKLSNKARSIANLRYRWEAVTDQYELLFRQLCTPNPA